MSIYVSRVIVQREDDDRCNPSCLYLEERAAERGAFQCSLFRFRGTGQKATLTLNKEGAPLAVSECLKQFSQKGD